MSGWVTPFRQFVIKVASRCDLACDHCYVYEHADQSWRARPKVISDQTISKVAQRITEHAKRHRLSTVHVIMHGGEPLLAGPERLARVAQELGRALDGVAELDLRIHTNGILLSERFCEVFDSADIKVGVSLDGDRAANDRHRRYANGRSSYDQVIAAITLLRDRYPHLYAGLLCTIDIRNDPVAVYEALLALRPPRIDFLLPHATWDRPPLRRRSGDTAYADWLIAIHDRWTAQGRPVPIRLFDSITWSARGRSGGTESLGLGPSDLIVIETDGSYEQADSLKVAYDGAPAMHLNVFDHSLDEAMSHPGVAARQGGTGVLSADCQVCPVVAICGGGLYAHRYRTGTGFMNPSVYCADLLKLITHVEGARRRRHTFPVSALDAIARGKAGRSETEALRAPQLSLTRSLVATGTSAADSDAWALLVRLERSHRAVVDQVLGHPYVRSWAARRAGVATGPVVPGHLAAVAAAIAIRAGAPATITVPVTGGAVHLPTLGRMCVPEGETAVIESADGAFTVRAGGRDLDFGGPGWEPVRTLEADGISVLFDDVDPHRDGHPAPVRERLTGSELRAWRKTFEAAWELLRTEHPEQAEAVAAGLQVVTPVVGEPGRFAVARHAYGAVALAECTDPGRLAMVLVGGAAGGRVTALLDMFDLAGRNARAAEELRDAYARLAMSALMEPEQAAAVRRDVRQTVDRLSAVAVSEAGRRFLAGLSDAASAGPAAARRLREGRPEP